MLEEVSRTFPAKTRRVYYFRKRITTCAYGKFSVATLVFGCKKCQRRFHGHIVSAFSLYIKKLDYINFSQHILTFLQCDDSRYFMLVFKKCKIRTITFL